MNISINQKRKWPVLVIWEKNHNRESKSQLSLAYFFFGSLLKIFDDSTNFFADHFGIFFLYFYFWSSKVYNQWYINEHRINTMTKQKQNYCHVVNDWSFQNIQNIHIQEDSELSERKKKHYCKNNNNNNKLVFIAIAIHVLSITNCRKE